jgi:hypothetical protein
MFIKAIPIGGIAPWRQARSGALHRSKFRHQAGEVVEIATEVAGRRLPTRGGRCAA